MSFGPPELLLILVLVLIVFGAGKLPQVFSSLGKGVKEFRDASEGVGDTPPAGTTTTTTTEQVTPTANTVPPAVTVTQQEVKKTEG